VQLQATGNDKVFAFRRAKDGNAVSVAVAAWDYRIDAPRK
jgi:hypothetical protein